MSQELSDKVVAVTGAASGIGPACAEAYVKAGARVFLVDRAADQLGRVCADLGPSAVPLVVDLLDSGSVAGMMPQILESAGQLDVFHANAGAYIGGELLDSHPDDWDRMLSLNVNAVFRTVHAVLPHMVERKTGGGGRRRLHPLVNPLAPQGLDQPAVPNVSVDRPDAAGFA